MNWNIETGKLISMGISIIVMILMTIKYRKTGKENLFFIIGYFLFSLIDIFCYFYYDLTGLPTDVFYVIGFLMIVFFCICSIIISYYMFRCLKRYSSLF